MFYCQVSGLLSKPGEKPHKIIVETRDRVYSRRIKNEETREWETVEVGRGFEIVKEIIATHAGFQEWNEMSAEQKADFVNALKCI